MAEKHTRKKHASNVVYAGKQRNRIFTAVSNAYHLQQEGRRANLIHIPGSRHISQAHAKIKGLWLTMQKHPY